MCRLAAVGTGFPFPQLGLGPKGLTGSAVVAFILALVYVALVVKFLKNVLGVFFVLGIRRSYKSVVVNVHGLPKFFNLIYDHVHIFFRLHACLCSCLFNFLAVFVGACCKEYVIALKLLVSLDSVRRNGTVCMAYV